MKILNLYAGVGGNRKLWSDQHDITSVELDPEIAAVYAKLYPQDTLIVGDAHEYLLNNYSEFDFIWSSPPCPTHSRLQTMFENKCYPDMSLYKEIIFLKSWFKGQWVVENVIPYYTPLIPPTSIVDRHYVWSSMFIRNRQFRRNYSGGLVSQNVETLSKAYDIDLPGDTRNKRKLLRNAVMPEIGQYIISHYREKQEQLTL